MASVQVTGVGTVFYFESVLGTWTLTDAAFVHQLRLAFQAAGVGYTVKQAVVTDVSASV